jgi:uncharacterized DUF497 family protein
VWFEWNLAKAAANLKRHRVSFHEDATVLDDPLSTTFPDEVHSQEEVRLVTIGASTLGKVLVVAHTGRTTPSASSAPAEPRGASEEQDQVAPLAQPCDVLAADAAPHRA